MKPNINTARTFAIVLAVVASGIVPGLVPDVVAQDSGQVTIDARYCPSDSGSGSAVYSDRCTGAGVGAEFTMTQQLPDGPQVETVRADEAGRVVFAVDAQAESLTINGPVYEFFRGEPSIRFACGDVDPDDPQIFSSRGITINALEGGLKLSCIWYVRETAGEASDWEGGFTDLVPGVYPEGMVSIYGANSEYPEASATLDIPYWDANGVQLELEGIDDELQAKVDIEVLVNGNSVYSGPSDFPDHVPGLEAPGTMTFNVPAEYLETETKITVRNLEPDASVGLPPWVQVREVRILGS